MVRIDDEKVQSVSARVLKVAFLPAWLLILGTRNLWGHYASRGLRRRNEQARAELWRKPLAPSEADPADHESGAGA